MVFHLPLQSHLVVLALEGSRFAEGRDLTNHRECEAALTAMVQNSLWCVIDDSPEARALLIELENDFK
jgi:hypothetical protein